MRTYSRLASLFLIATCFIGAVPVAAQEQPLSSANAVTHPPEEEQEWIKIRAIKDRYIEAAKAGEVDSLAPFLSKNFTATMLTGEEIKSFDDLKEYNRKMQELVGPGATHEMTVHYDPGYMVGNLAIAHGSTDELVVTSLKNQFKFHSLWTGILIKEDGNWKVHRLHVSMNPTDNEFVTYYYSKAVRKYGTIALMIGLLTGVVGGRWWGRRAIRRN